MKKTRIALFCSIIMILLGSVLFIGVAAANHFDFSKFNTETYEEKNYVFEEEIKEIELTVSADDVRLVRSQDEKCRLTCFDSESTVYEVASSNGVLKVKSKSQGKNFHLSFGVGTEHGVTLALPATVLESLTVVSSSGKVESEISLSVHTAKIVTSSGNVSLKNWQADCLELVASSGETELEHCDFGKLSLVASSGKADLEYCRADSLEAVTSSGEINAENITATDTLTLTTSSGRVELENTSAAKTKVKTGSGNIELKQVDGDDILLESTSGNITGTLASGRTFEVSSDSGNIAVPSQTVGAPPCKVSTVSGNIRLTVAK